MNKITYQQTIQNISGSLPADRRSTFVSTMALREKSTTTALILSLLFGCMGIDRFYIGNVGLGIGKLVTLGGLGIWALVDLFLIMGATRDRNAAVAQEVRQLLA